MSASNHDDAPRPEQSAASPACSLAYLCSTYVALSMVFVMREVRQLRELGLNIDVACINPPDRALADLTAVEQAEAKRTYCVKEHGISGAAAAHVQALFQDLFGYMRGLRLALRLGGLDLRRLLYNFLYFTEALMIGQWMRRKGQKHLHVHLASQAATVGMFVHHVFAFGFSITVHGPDEFYDATGQYLAEKIAAADFICCITAFTRSQLMMLSPYAHWHKFVLARVGIDTTVFSPRPGRPVRDAFEILCIGRLTPAKGQHLLIDAVDALARQGRSVRLRLGGRGPDESSLREHAASIEHPQCIVFEGGVDQDRICSLYAAADVFCLPSFAEGLPGVLMEAMAMEIPCVTTHITGVPELICDGVNGLLVPPSDVDALVQALTRLMDDAELQQRIGRNSRARVVERHDLRRNMERLAGIFTERVKG
jgi:glycosyltransferase involved in cell wall biosynthesis